ncbi:putative reverse transcriptase domain-containing protein [Tanacetum coccineum]
MVDCLSIVRVDKVIHTMETDIVKLVVEIESFGMSSDQFDKETGSSDRLQQKQADLSCVYALNKLHLHEIRVVPRDCGEGKAKSCGEYYSFGLNPSLPTQETTSAGNAPGGNGVDVVVPLESIRAISEQFVNTAYGFFLGKRVAYPVVANYVKLHGVPIMAFSEDGLSAIATKLADVELRDNIVAAIPKITGEGYYNCNIRVEYEWKPPRCACCKVFGHTQEECPKNIGTGEMKNLKKTSQTPKGFPVGQKMVFKPTKQVYQPVSKEPAANTSVNKKKNVDPTKEVSMSNPFDVLTSIENDVELCTNRGTSNLDSQATNSSGSSFWNVDASSPSTTHVIEKINKIEKLIIEEKVTLVDDEGTPLEKVVSSCDYDSEDEVASVDNDMAKFLAKKDGYGTQSLLEQWTESYENGDYGYDPYDDDMYEG